MEKFKELWHVCTDICGEDLPKWLERSLGLIATLIVIFGYANYSAWHHRPIAEGGNPDDKTIPTYAQIWVGAVNIIEPLKFWRNKWDPPGTTSRVWPTYDELVEGTSRMIALENIHERKMHGVNQREIVVNSIATFTRFFIALGYSILFGILIGLFTGSSKFIDALLYRWMKIFSRVIALALLPLFLATSEGEDFFRNIILIGIIPILAMGIRLSVKAVKQPLIDKAKIQGSSRLEIVFRTILPTILPEIFDLIRINVGPILMILFATEFINSDVGIGYVIRRELKGPNMPIISFFVVHLICFGMLVDRVILTLRNWTCLHVVPEKKRGGPRLWIKKFKKHLVAKTLQKAKEQNHV